MVTEIFGSLVAAVCVNLALYTLEVVMACRLFRDEKSEAGRLAKFGVSLNLFIDSLATVAGCAFLYMFQGWSNDDTEVQSRYWRAIIAILTAGTAVSVISQTFLLGRFWRNIRQHLLGTAFAVTLLVMAVLASVAAVVICAFLQWNNSPIVNPFIWVALIATFVAALGITVVSVCQRIAISSTVGPQKHIITRGCRAFIQTGMPSTILVLLALVAWAVGRKGDFVMALLFVNARIYSCTMLFTLLSPAPIRTDLWLQDMVEASVQQKGLPTPDIYLKNEKTLGDIPEDKPMEQGWYNIDLGSTLGSDPFAPRRSSSEGGRNSETGAVVLRRGSMSRFFQVPLDLERR
ncbi:hypothetical protein FB45DRAFT_431960 [Roridomyces roridus]|uniref:Uncharacterized protein n=1 Tax=Roridomyces roridus TaxID=1738132 RepID=A0AAD7F9U3_9AGAR|nr:hypothetical protein FB45DRAFT_431960 [Roridomyces roridus]